MSRPGGGLAATLGAAVLAVGCGSGGASGSATSSDLRSAATAFVSAVTRGDRRAWCAQIGLPVGGPVTRPMSGTALATCRQDDLFNTTGSEDVERRIRGASIDHVHSAAGAATVTLSSRVELLFRRVGGRWLLEDWRASGR